jgi:hypothetical protein
MVVPQRGGGAGEQDSEEGQKAPHGRYCSVRSDADRTSPSRRRRGPAKARRDDDM